MINRLLYSCVITFFLGFILTATAQNKDTLTTTSSDSTLLQKAQKKYNRLFYQYYGKYANNHNAKRSDTNYICSYPEYIVLSANLGYPYLSYTISPVHSGKITTSYIANISSVFGLKISYKNLFFGYSFKLKSNFDNTDYARTSYSSFNFRIQSNKFNQGLSFSYLKGLTDVGSNQTSSAKESYYKREDIQFLNLTYDFIWNLSWRKYSFVAPRTYGQRQIKSRTGFLMKAGISINSATGDSAIINPPAMPEYIDFKNVASFSGIALELAPGVGGNLVFAKSFFLSSSVFVGPNYYYYVYKNTKSIEQSRASSFQLVFDLHLSVGHQSERFFLGITGEFKSLNVQVTDAQFQWYNAYIGFNAGYRLNAPRLLKKGYNLLFPY